MVCVSKQLCRLKIQAAAGSLFSASGKYRNCLRINVALPPTDKNRDALKKWARRSILRWRSRFLPGGGFALPGLLNARS
jgi:DNA-binding transcriptional MocR family regulator